MHQAEPRHHPVAIFLYQLQYTVSFTDCWSLNLHQIFWMFITVITKVHVLNQPNLIQTCISYLCKILFNRYILPRLCLGLPCGLFHFATLWLWATCVTSYLFNLTCSWRMKNVKLFNFLKVTVQQPVTIFFLSFCSPENFCWMLLSSSTSHHACALNRSCVEAGALCSGVGHSSTQKWGVVEQCYDFFVIAPCILISSKSII